MAYILAAIFFEIHTFEELNTRFLKLEASEESL